MVKMMRDDTDVYISRCLKNWTARSQAPQNRADLLHRAATPEAPYESWLLRLLNSITVRTRPGLEPVYVHSHISTQGPFTLFTLWSFHLVANQRLAT
jgi:hypothetical protein